MNTLDARVLSPAAQEDLRQRVVKAIREGGLSQSAAARTFDVSRTSVMKWLQAVQRGGSAARGLAASRPRGRRPEPRLKGWQAALGVRSLINFTMQLCKVARWGHQPRSCPALQGGPGVRSDMEFWRSGQQVLTGQISRRAALKKYGLGWHLLTNILTRSEPPGYRTSQPRPTRKLEPYLPIIQEMLEDERQVPKKLRHTAKRIFERLRPEHG
jgi:transposase